MSAPGEPVPPRLYSDLAAWWPLLSPPSHYAEEAPELLALLEGAASRPARTLLELGCGGGSVAFHLKRRFRLTLTDRSRQMLDVSRAVNPECEHLVGDMTGLDLRRRFDLVLVHDAIAYAASADALARTFRTAHGHLEPGGALVLLPDYVAETYQPGTCYGGEDAPDGRGLRYLEWTWDPDPGDETYEVAYAFLLRAADGSVAVDSDRHRCGLFPHAAWLAGLREAGFAPRAEEDSYGRSVFVGVRG